ncbi:hypothetical protein WCLP8_4470001 [uncultured Gammaproteobacteria bacterium]
MEPVVETAAPSDPSLIVTGSHVTMINGVPTRVWDTVAAAPQPPAPDMVDWVPPAISKRQLLLASWQEGLITEAEAIAAASTGALPAAISAALTSLTADQQIAFRITWAAMVQVDRSNPFVPIMAQAFGKDDTEIDQFFLDAATL